MTPKEQMEYEREWHLDKKVPIALILALSLQSLTAVWWASAISSRVEHLERQQTTSAPQGDRLTRLEAKFENIERGLDEIKQLLRAR